MSDVSIDISYAYIQLGLDVGADMERVHAVEANAAAYRFATRERIQETRLLAGFFTARQKFGDPEVDFAAIRRVYHKQALALHPDRNPGDKAAEEKLKSLNVAFGIVDEVYRQARAFYRLSETEQVEAAREARRKTERENPTSARQAFSWHARSETTRAKDKQDNWYETYQAPPTKQASDFSARKYHAAFVPRYIRNARLFTVGLDAIIGSKLVKPEGSVGLMYDLLMLPEKEFIRARYLLGTETRVNPNLSMSSIVPTFIPKDIRTVIVPDDVMDPHNYAREKFLEMFNLNQE